MMDIEMPIINPSQQDMDLIDILWRQDIDLGARREVFDLSHRQKERAARRQREQEEEKRRRLQREQEEALLAQLQLDEETGEYIPRPAPPPGADGTTPPQPDSSSSGSSSGSPPLGATQDVGGFAGEEGDAMSFDECMQLLAETFPLVEEATEPAPPARLETRVAAPTPDSSRRAVMPPEQPALPQAPLLPAPLMPLLPAPLMPQAPLLPAPLQPQRTSPDLEQAWMELLSLPELQQCLSMQMEDTLETTTYLPPSGPPAVVQDPPGYSSFYPPLPQLSDVGPTVLDVCPPPEEEFIIHAFAAGPFSSAAVATPDHLSQMTLKAPQQLNTDYDTESFCEMFYPGPAPGLDLDTKEGVLPGREGNGHHALPEIPTNHAPYEPTDAAHNNLSPADTFDTCKREATAAEFPDSDSGVSLNNASPTASSPEEKSAYGGYGGYSDSDAEEMDMNPGSAESDYSEMFSLNFQPDAFFQPDGSSLPPELEAERAARRDKTPKRHKTEPAEEAGHDDAPFAVDKQEEGGRRATRLSRDEQRARALAIPFAVDGIVNLPVDDFNEMMSKQRLDEAQLALVRDIRRRGKNKVAAQNCRKRKMENIVGLEYDLDALQEERERLAREKRRNEGGLRDMKQRLSGLYLQVFGLLRDEEGAAYSPADYSLQQTSDGSVFLVPRSKKTAALGGGKRSTAP